MRRIDPSMYKKNSSRDQAKPTYSTSNAVSASGNSTQSVTSLGYIEKKKPLRKAPSDSKMSQDLPQKNAIHQQTVQESLTQFHEQQFPVATASNFRPNPSGQNDNDLLLNSTFSKNTPPNASFPLTPPPPPPKPPVQPEPPFPMQSNGPTYDRKKIQPEDLLAGKHSLKKLNRKDVFDPATLEKTDLFRNDEGISEEESEYLPLHIARLNIVNMNLTTDLVCLNLLGVEMLTDALFFVLKFGQTTFRSLKKFICTGCHHLSDIGLIWASGMMPELMMCELEACYKVTEKGLTFLVQNCPKLQNLSIVATNVGRIPLGIGKSHVASGDLRAQGTPLISSGFTIVSKKQEKTVNKGSGDAILKKQVKDIETFKLVVLRDESMTRTLKGIIQQESTDSVPPPIAFWDSWHPNSMASQDKNEIFNVTECAAMSVFQDVVLSAGSIVMITYLASSIDTEQVADRLARTIGMVLAKCPDVVIVIMGLKKPNEESQVHSVQELLRSKLQGWMKAASVVLERHISRTWRLGMLDFNGQLSLATGALVFEMLVNLTDLKEGYLIMFSTIESNIDIALGTCLSAAAESIKRRVSWVHDPVDSSCFLLANSIPSRIVTTSQEIYNDFDLDTRKQFHLHQPYQHMRKIVDFMMKLGQAICISGSSSDLCVTNLLTYAELVNAFLSTPPPKNDFVAYLKADIAYWDLEGIADFVKNHNLDVKVDLFIKFLKKQGLVLPIRLPWKQAPQGQKQDGIASEAASGKKPQMVYILFRDIPETHSVLERLWPDTVPANTHSAALFHSILPGLPESVLVHMFRHIMKVFQPLLLWRTGMLIRQGPVDIFVQLWHNDQYTSSDGTKVSLPSQLCGTPVLVISGRIPLLSVSLEGTDNKTRSNDCLWGAMQTVCVITDYIFRSHNIFTNVTFPCEICCKNNLKKALEREACFHFGYYVTQPSEMQDSKCPFHKNNKINVKETCGPQYDSVVPYHNYMYLEASNNWISHLMTINHFRPPDPLTPCFLCCEETDLLCPHCHICVQCIKLLAKYEKSIKPGFVRSSMVQCSDLFDKSKMPPDKTTSGKDSALKIRGCVLRLKRSQEVTLMKPMTPLYFDSLSMMVFRGHKYVFIGELANNQRIEFHWNTGKFIDQHGKSTTNAEFKGHEGYFLTIKMKFSETPGKSVILLYLSGLEIARQEVDGLEMFISFNLEGSCTCVFYAPGVKTSWQQTDKVLPELGNTVEVLSEDNSKTESAIFAVPPQMGLYVVTTTTGETLHAINKRIRPRGYAELKNKEIIGTVDELKAPANTFKAPLQLWKFRQHQLLDCLNELIKKINEPEDLVAPCTQIFSPSVMFGAIEHMKDKVEKALFQKGHVDYHGSAVVLLPENLTVADLIIVPIYSLTGQLEAHPLCYIRGDINSVMTVMPTYNLPAQVECFHVVHLVNNSGFSFTLQDISKPILWAWALMLLRLQKEGLASYDRLLESVDGLTNLSNNQIWAGLKNITRQMVYLLYLSFLFDEYYFQNYEAVKEAVQILKKKLQVHVDEEPNAFGLEKVSSVFTNTDMHMCPGHAGTWQAGRSLTEFPDRITVNYPQFIYSLLLANNNLCNIPGSVFTILHNLKDLDLADNQLESLPVEIGHCTQLTSLGLDRNCLTELPDTLANCELLNRLEISRNKFTKFPLVITKLRNLFRLYAQNLQLTVLPEDIGNLQELRKLYLNGNCFTSLPSTIVKLQKLQDLSLNGVPWCKVRANQLLSKENFEDMLNEQNLTRWLEKHNQNKTALFQQFDEDTNGTLDPKEIGKLNATIFTLFPRIGYMRSEPPDDDTPHGFPEEILSLQNLEYLSLQYQGLVGIPAGISQLKCLNVLNVSHNPNLLSLAAQAGSLPLKRLEMDECPLLKTPPKEIRAKGFTSTYAYLKRLLSGSVECKRTKLMLVGLGGAGKTSLVRALMSSKDKADMAIGEEITDGIDICPWTVKTDEGLLTFSVWDFAGQTVYYNTHQFFLSDRAVYLLLWNIRLGHEHAGLDFWLSSISVHAPKAPIFVIGTHVDQVSKVELPLKEMKQRYSQIIDFFFISSFSGQGIQKLRERMLEVTLQQQYMGEKIPGVWLGFEESLKCITTNRSVIPYTELENIANKSGIFEKSEIAQAVQFLHELGSLQHFTNDFLKNQVVINPQWIVDVMACVVSVKDSAIKEGHLWHKDIGLVWKDYPVTLHSWLLRLTEEYDLTFPLKDQAVNLVPCLLTEKEPDFSWPDLEKGSGLRETKMVYKFDYLPAGLFNRGQVRLHEFSDSSLVWKRGSYLRKNGHICLVRQTRGSELVVRAQGPSPENILFLVHEVFEGLIMESFQGVTYDFQIPCPECLRLMLKGPHMFTASTVRRAVELKAPFLQCLKYFHTVSIFDLQGSMPPDNSTDYDLHLVQAVRGLKELQQVLTADIFISFCKKDEKGDKAGAIEPSRIIEDVGKLGYRSWVASETSSHSMDEMARALMDASIFLAFMTNNYVNDENCCNLFKYARLTLHKPILLVTIGSGFEWLQSKLGILLADEVYINMQQPDRYQAKFEELKSSLRERVDKKINTSLQDFPPCFISYCWQNSAQAVAKGTKSVEGAIGHGDPREIKDYLENKGISCWIDIERVGVHGLFEDIGEGLVNAKVVVVCMSDQYAASSICVSEFRFVARTLKLPIVLAIVGSGHGWRASEVGTLSQNYPLVSFQEQQSTASLDRLVSFVQPYINSPDAEVKDKKKIAIDNKEQKSHSFQELCELVQRKFLRQLAVYAEGQGLPPYPQLFLVDFAKTDEKITGDQSREEKPGENDVNELGDEQNDFHQQKFVVHTLCEHEEGWHLSGEPIPLPTNFGPTLDEFAPFIARITAIAKYSKKLVMNCMASSRGLLFLQWLEKNPKIAESSDFQQSYLKLRLTVSQADENQTMGNLARCHLPNGRLIWLCEKHRQNTRVTVLSNMDTVSSTHTGADIIGMDYMIQALREMNTGKLSQHDSGTELTSALPASVATSSSDTSSGSPLSLSFTKHSSKLKMSPAVRMTEPQLLQRQPSQLTFSGTKSRACSLI